MRLPDSNIILVIYVAMVLLAGVKAHAGELNHKTILTIDKPGIQPEDLHFPNDENIQPEKSDIEIVSYILLSSEAGERRATVTFANTSNGQRILEKHHILALYANGERRPPLFFKQKFSGREKITLDLNFGASKFPILSVYTRN